MNRNAISIPRQSSSKRKRKVEPISYFKKLRSKIPRRKRFHISPILVGSSNSLISDKKPGILAIPAVSSSSSYFTEEVSCTSSWISVGSNDLKKKPRSSRRKRAIEEIRGSEVVSQLHERSCRQPGKIPDEQFRRITRSYYRQKENVRTIRKKGDGNFGVALSESSCVEPSSAADAAIACKSDEFADRNLKLKSRSRNGAETEKESEGMAASTAITLSGSSFSQPISQENVQSLFKAGEVSGELWKPRAKGAGNSAAIPDNEAISEISCVESLSEAKNQNVCPSAGETSKKVTKNEGKRAPEAEFSGLSRNYVESNLAVSISESTAEKKPKDFDFDSDFACSENLSYEDDSDYSTSHELTLSELEPFFSNNSDVEITDEWLCLESPRDFSERSAGNSTPSASFSLFLQYTLQFSKSSSHPDVGVSSRLKEEYLDDCTLLRFEDEEHEESYKNFRSRERRQVFLSDYTEDYFLTTEFGDLVLQQRLLMVNWIIEQSNAKELQSETLFLGVSLLDRFLSRGFFKQRRSLQIVGIACLMLAIRMEENQPYNCVRQKVFHVGSNVYSRCEVVAMEWQVQKVLNFQCFLPTTYNFLWFYLKAAKADAEVEKRAKYLAVLSLMDHEQLCYWPSTVAAGLVILASLASNHDSSCQSVMETHVRTKNDDLPECIQSLEWLVKYVC